MATKSILKNINVRGRKQIKMLADAMEHAEAFQGKEVTMSRPVSEIKGDKIKDFFNGRCASCKENRS